MRPGKNINEKHIHFRFQLCVTLDDFGSMQGSVVTGAMLPLIKRKLHGNRPCGTNIPKTLQRLIWMLQGKGDARWDVRISAQPKSLQVTLSRRYRLAAPLPVNWILRVSVPTQTRRRGTADVTADIEHTESCFRASTVVEQTMTSKIISDLFTHIFFYGQHREHIYPRGKEINEVMCITCHVK